MDDHVVFWRAATNEEDEIYCNPRARAADKADWRLEGRLQRRRNRLEAQRRQWNWSA